MAHHKRISTILLSFIVAGGLFAGCGSDEEDDGDNTGPATGSPEETASVCESASDCFTMFDAAALAGEPRCLDRVRGGHCTHLCETDDDCCAVEGECRTDIRQVCAPFESTGERMCFLSCEGPDIEASDLRVDGGLGENEYCQRLAGRDFHCRSTGGGSENRKVCVPADCGVGAACAVDDECDPGQTCLTDFAGGYCGVRDCTSSADCPGTSVCVEAAGGNVCMATCQADFDCSLCRGAELGAACDADVTLVDGTTASVCRPIPR